MESPKCSYGSSGAMVASLLSCLKLRFEPLYFHWIDATHNVYLFREVTMSDRVTCGEKQCPKRDIDESHKEPLLPAAGSV